MEQRTAAARIDWLDLSGVPGLAGGTGRIGMCGLAWAITIDASDDVDVLVSLLDTPATFEELAPRTRVVRHPIVEMGVPGDRHAFLELVGSIVEDVRAGRSVVVSCLAGYGRTGLTVGCVLVDLGVPARDAVAWIRGTRPGTIETPEQLAYVQGWR